MPAHSIPELCPQVSQAAALVALTPFNSDAPFSAARRLRFWFVFGPFARAVPLFFRSEVLAPGPHFGAFFRP